MKQTRPVDKKGLKFRAKDFFSLINFKTFHALKDKKIKFHRRPFQLPYFQSRWSKTKKSSSFACGVRRKTFSIVCCSSSRMRKSIKAIFMLFFSTRTHSNEVACVWALIIVKCDGMCWKIKVRNFFKIALNTSKALINSTDSGTVSIAW